MSETKLLTDSIKDGLYDNLLGSINEKFALEIIKPPQKLYDHMKGKVVESETENQEINRLFSEWMDRTLELLRSKAVTLNQLFDVVPDPWRSGLIKDLKEWIAANSTGH